MSTLLEGGDAAMFPENIFTLEKVNKIVEYWAC